MKKLFLYLIIYILLFVVTYNVALSFAKKDMENKSIHGTEADDQAAVGFSEGAEDISAEEMLYETENEESMSENEEENVLISHAATDKYIVGLKNNYVIVYKNDMTTVFEYTDIEGDVLKANDEKAYDMILNNVEFENKEDMFDFLESLSS